MTNAPPLTALDRTRELLALLPRRPFEFVDRVRAIGEVNLERLAGRPEYATTPWAETLNALKPYLGDAAASEGGSLAELRRHLVRHFEAVAPSAPIDLSHNGDVLLGRLCYLACRALKPAVVVETGVAYGITSSHILLALHENGRGELHSVDLPPLGRGNDAFVGSAIPGHLKQRWRLYRGATRRILPRLMRRLGKVDLFVHDSLHTYWTMRFEFETAWPRIPAGGMLISDDVQDNRAFAEIARLGPRLSCVVREQEKDSLLGVAVK